MATVSFRKVWKLFGENRVVENLNLEANDGEFLVLVGPSGCGKTTTLRMLAGLETPTYGDILIGDSNVTLAPPGKRDIAMVFQSYALYPHMTVYNNLAFGPRIRKEPKSKVDAEINVVAETLGVGHLLKRKPSELSGGQRQRIALGRVMLRSPQISLFDEPLSNLDAALRVQMRGELVKLQQRLGVTTVYVTHDQIEAMTMGTRIAVMDHGKLIQVDTPGNLYDRPVNLHVATFIGSPKMNVVHGESNQLELTTLGAKIPFPSIQGERKFGSETTGLKVGIRPHDLRLALEAPARATCRVQGVVEVVEPTGAETFAVIRIGNEVVTAYLTRIADARVGDVVELAFDPNDLYLFDSKSHVSVLDRQVRGQRPAVPDSQIITHAEEGVHL